jgi:hydroxymethylglutaryl-CoA lyase
VTITDVTLREYGQNVPRRYLPVFTPEIRARIARALIEAGFTNLEVISCVHPGVAPAMNRKDLEIIAGCIGRQDGVHIITLVPNGTGYESFLDLDLGPEGYNHSMGIFFSAVEAHNRANLGRSIPETVSEYESIMKDAMARNIRVVATLSAAFGYREKGQRGVTREEPGRINDYINSFFDMGAVTVGLSDLQGVAGEKETRNLLETILDMRKGADREKLVYHPHHVSEGQALANSLAAFDLGIRRFDASLGGTGGCVTGAPGNQPTEGLVRAFHKAGIMTGLDEAKVPALGQMVQRELYNEISLDPSP